jgi:hypothetical protein
MKVRRPDILLAGVLLTAFIVDGISGWSTTVTESSGTGGQLSLGSPSLASGQLAVPITTSVASNSYSGYNAHITFDGTKLTYGGFNPGGILRPNGATNFCVAIATDGGSGATGSCNINGPEQTTSAGTLATFTLNRLVMSGCASIRLINFGPPDNGDSNTGSYTINSFDSTAQSNTYGVKSLTVNLANGQAVADSTDTDSDGEVDECDGDDDNDAWADGSELVIGTDPLDACADDAADDAWPADINNDGFSDITDISALGGSFGKSVPPAPARHDIAPDPPDGFVDITDIGRIGGFFGKDCSAP